jgi:antitoxin HigA-1
MKLKRPIVKKFSLKNIHPGDVLQKEYLHPLEITSQKLSKDIGIPQTRVSEILKGNRRITDDTALRLSRYFGNSAKFWLGLQADYDIEEEEQLKAKEFESIELYQSKATQLCGRTRRDIQNC